MAEMRYKADRAFVNGSLQQQPLFYFGVIGHSHVAAALASLAVGAVKAYKINMNLFLGKIGEYLVIEDSGVVCV